MRNAALAREHHARLQLTHVPHEPSLLKPSPGTLTATLKLQTDYHRQYASSTARTQEVPREARSCPAQWQPQSHGYPPRIRRLPEHCTRRGARREGWRREGAHRHGRHQRKRRGHARSA